jgi:hypothetical protein
VANEAHGLWGPANERYFGLLEIAGAPGCDHALVVGLRNSHDKRFAAGLCYGASVFVCDNLSFSSEVTLARRHTRHIEASLPQLVSTAVARLTEQRGRQEERFAAYKQAELTDRDAHHLMIASLRAKALPAGRLPQLVKEWHEPSHAEFSDRNIWRLFNAATESLKGSGLSQLPTRTQVLHGICDAYCGLHTSA